MEGQTHDRPYLLAWKLHGRRVLVVGGGTTGTAKVETLQGTGARIVVVDPSPSPRVVDLAQRGEVELRRRAVRRRDVIGVTLVVAATDDPVLNRRLRRWAHRVGAVVNAVDDPANCDVTVPSVVRRGPATIAISTGGRTPAGARVLREVLTDAVDRALPETFGQALDEAGRLRRELRGDARYRYDYPRWRDGFFMPALAACRAGIDGVEDLADAFLAGWDDPDPPQPGRVSLVGAGPGGPDLITVRGANLLRQADVVVYDRLAGADLLDLAPVAAERIPVGKRKGGGVTQSDINDLLIERAAAGHHVVRLKGGDPFVFGRGGEEADAVRSAGLAVEIVPGVSSALAAPSLAGIALTDRRLASSFTVVTGHRVGDDPADATFPGPGATLVVLMGATTADRIATRLIELGWSADQPVAFIHRASTADERTATARLATVAIEGCPFAAPTVMVLGPTVTMDLGPDLHPVRLPRPIDSTVGV